MKRALIIISISLAYLASATAGDIDLSKDFESLGGNKALIKRAKALDPKNKVRIVQRRSVDRNLRLELGLSYGGVASGNTYMETENLGASIDFHITPRWSLGVRHYKSYNELTREGDSAYSTAATAVINTNAYDYRVPAIDYPISTTLAVINWYPIYGKINLLNKNVVQFDIYGLAGGGQVELASGPTGSYTLGGGVGFWLNQNFSTRLEVRYQNYQDKPLSQPRDLDLVIGTASIGWML